MNASDLPLHVRQHIERKWGALAERLANAQAQQVAGDERTVTAVAPKRQGPLIGGAAADPGR